MKAKLTNIKLSEIIPNPENPRKKISKEELTELAQSIVSVGLLQPITVRTKSDKFEIVCGHRRAEAARLAGLDEVPCIIREMTDDEAYEVMVTENLQRKDIDPFEEADAFVALENKGYDVQALADKFGKSLAYIYGRVKLNDLLPELHKLYEDGEIDLSHCLILSRLDKVMQGWLRNKYYSTKADYYSLIGQPVKKLKDTIAGVGRKLDMAPFDKSQCANCPKNTDCASLFLDFGESICQDEDCYGKKYCDFAIPIFEELKAREPEFCIIKNWNLPTIGNEKKLLDDLISRGFDIKNIEYYRIGKPVQSNKWDISDPAIKAYEFGSGFKTVKPVEEKKDQKPFQRKDDWWLNKFASERQIRTSSCELEIIFGKIQKEEIIEKVDTGNLLSTLICYFAERLYNYDSINGIDEQMTIDEVADAVEKMNEDDKKEVLLKFMMTNPENIDSRFVKAMFPTFVDGVEEEAKAKFIETVKGYWYNYDNVTDEMVEADLAERLKKAEVEEAIEESQYEEDNEE